MQGRSSSYLANNLLHILVERKPKTHHLYNLRSLSSHRSTHFADHSHSPAGASISDEFSSDVEKLYRILRKFHIRPAKLELALRDSGIFLRHGILERVISRCGPATDLAISFYSWVSGHRPDLPPSAAAHRALLSSLTRARHFGAAWALLDRMRREIPEALSVDVFVALIRRFAAARMVSKAIQVLDEMPDYGFPPDDYVFACLLDALCKNGSVKEAASLFREMRDRFNPNLRHFTSLLYGWCRSGRLEEAKFVLVQMREAGFDPDVVVYNTLLAGFSAAGKMEDSYALLVEMRSKGCFPNVISYTTLIQALCSRERMDDAMRLFVEMRRNDCTPDAVTYNTLISGFCKSGSLDRAYEFLDAMDAPNPASYFPIFTLLEQKEDLDKCTELMNRMEKSSRLLDLNIYNVVIRLACKLGEVERALAIWNEMEASRFTPGLDSFIIMIHGYIDQSMLIEAAEFFKKMVARGLLTAPQYGTLKTLLNSLLRDGKLELAEDVWACMVSKGCVLNVCAWTIWVHALFSNKHVKVACSYCLDMMDEGVMPQPDTFAKLMKGLRKLYNRQIAAEITEKVRVMAEERNVTFKMYKRRGEMNLERKRQREEKTKRESRKWWGYQPGSRDRDMDDLLGPYGVKVKIE